jgi:hypothetical protein
VNPHDEDFLGRIFDEVDLVEPTRAPSRLKAKVYSALMRQQAELGPLMSLSEARSRGEKLCFFEQLVQVAPLGETAKSLNICRVCHARVLAEHFENPPIYWPGCPYVDLKNS